MCVDLPLSSSHEGVDPWINTDKASQSALVDADVAKGPGVFLLALIDDDALDCLLLPPSFSPQSVPFTNNPPDSVVCSGG